MEARSRTPAWPVCLVRRTSWRRSWPPRRRVGVIAVPHRADEVAGVSNEPRIAIGVGGAGLASGWNAVERGAPSWAFADDVAHHARHVGGDGSGNGLKRLLAVAIEAPDQVAGAGPHFEH